jgi:hypothetical protein
VNGRILVAGFVAVGLTAAAGAWWVRSADEPVTVDRIGDQVQTVMRGRLPEFARSGEVAELYRFAAQNPDWLRWIPCTCGCGALGHPSNRACYIKDERPDRVTFTSHAAS